MSAGDFVWRAVGNVSSTIAHASSTVTGSSHARKRHDISDDAVEKCTLTIKCTPRKDAATTTALSIKSGYLMKRNEQGQWHKRFVCTVPHLFLYYFDSDTADSPRGVIDLELYTNITQNKNALKVSTAHEEKLRTFHFMSDDEETLNNWLAHFLRDRYFAVCEERSAYQHMQSELTTALDSMNNQTKVAKVDKEVVDKQLQDALLDKQESMKVLQTVLVTMGITEEEMSQLTDLHQISQCLQASMSRIKKDLEARFYQVEEELEAEKAARLEERLEQSEILEIEIQSRKNLETALMQQKKAAELQAAEFKSQMDAQLLNLQTIVASKDEMNVKNTELMEQRKLLVKEVKRTRAKLAETEASLDLVGSVNGKLTTMVTALQAELDATRAQLEKNEQARVAQETGKKLHHQPTPTSPGVSHRNVEKLLLESQAAISALNTLSSNEATDQRRRTSSASLDAPSPAHSLSASLSGVDLASSTARERFSGSNNASAKTLPSPTHLSTPSPAAAASTQAESSGSPGKSNPATSTDPASAATTSSSTFSIFSNTFSRFSATLHASPATTHSSATAQSKDIAHTNALNHASEDTAPNTAPATVNVEKDKCGNETGNKNLPQEDIDIDAGRLPSTQRLKCLRCAGSVEGPQFSTCKCANPVLSAEDLHTENASSTGKSTWGFGSIFSKSSSAIVGGLAKASHVNLTTHAPQVAQSTSGSATEEEARKKVGKDEDNREHPTKHMSDIVASKISSLPAAAEEIVHDDNDTSIVSELVKGVITDAIQKEKAVPASVVSSTIETPDTLQGAIPETRELDNLQNTSVSEDLSAKGNAKGIDDEGEKEV